MRRIFEEKAKPLPITGKMVENAFKKVKENRGSAGIDKISITQFEKNYQTISTKFGIGYLQGVIFHQQ